MIENTKLTALVASRICHDMVEPMSAIIQGLEMIKDGDGKPDPDALNLLDHGVGKAWAKLEFFRFAMAGAMAEGDSELEEGHPVATKLYSVLKADLVWSAPAVKMPRCAERNTTTRTSSSAASSLHARLSSRPASSVMTLSGGLSSST